MSEIASVDEGFGDFRLRKGIGMAILLGFSRKLFRDARGLKFRFGKVRKARKTKAMDGMRGIVCCLRGL